MTPHDVLAADLLLVNGRVLTMDARNAVAQAVAVRDGKIVAVGSTREIEPLAGVSSRVIGLDGRTAMPGLTDCHVHLASDSSRAVAAVECRDLYGSGITSVATIVSRITHAIGDIAMDMILDALGWSTRSAPDPRAPNGNRAS